jgi:hypothetical protein
MKLLQDWPVKVATPSSSTEPPWLQWGPLFGREARHRLPGGECPVRLESLSGPLKDALRSDRDTCRPHRHLGRRAELRLTLQRLGHVVDRRRRVRPRRHAMRAASLHSESCPVRAPGHRISTPARAAAAARSRRQPSGRAHRLERPGDERVTVR